MYFINPNLGSVFCGCSGFGVLYSCWFWLPWVVLRPLDIESTRLAWLLIRISPQRGILGHIEVLPAPRLLWVRDPVRVWHKKYFSQGATFKSERNPLWRNTGVLASADINQIKYLNSDFFSKNYDFFSHNLENLTFTKKKK